MTLWTQNDVSKCDAPEPNEFRGACYCEQHLSEWLRENDVPKPPNLRVYTSYRVNGSCVEDLTSHTESGQTSATILLVLALEECLLSLRR